jgi:hypothetical protein
MSEESVADKVNRIGRFTRELEHLINRCSIDNDLNTPDFILAEYIVNMLSAYNTAKARTDHWKGKL